MRSFAGVSTCQPATPDFLAEYEARCTADALFRERQTEGGERSVSGAMPAPIEESPS